MYKLKYKGTEATTAGKGALIMKNRALPRNEHLIMDIFWKSDTPLTGRDFERSISGLELSVYRKYADKAGRKTYDCGTWYD